MSRVTTSRLIPRGQSQHIFLEFVPGLPIKPDQFPVQVFDLGCERVRMNTLIHVDHSARSPKTARRTGGISDLTTFLIYSRRIDQTGCVAAGIELSVH